MKLQINISKAKSMVFGSRNKNDEKFKINGIDIENVKDEASKIAFDEDIMENNYMFVIL